MGRRGTQEGADPGRSQRGTRRESEKVTTPHMGVTALIMKAEQMSPIEQVH